MKSKTRASECLGGVIATGRAGKNSPTELSVDEVHHACRLMETARIVNGKPRRFRLLKRRSRIKIPTSRTLVQCKVGDVVRLKCGSYVQLSEILVLGIGDQVKVVMAAGCILELESGDYTDTNAQVSSNKHWFLPHLHFDVSVFAIPRCATTDVLLCKPDKHVCKTEKKLVLLH